MNKKAIAVEWVITMIILLVSMIIILIITRGFFSDSQTQIKQTQTDTFEDTDQDGIPNIQDRCKDTSHGLSVDFHGCASNQQPN